jgi:ATP-dependent protease HslVU (ClpYQ) peptidase subunit
MTCVVGIRTKKGVLIGADSAGSNGWTIADRLDRKIFRKNEEFIFGVCGSYRLIQLLKYKFSPPEIGRIGVDRYMNTAFIDEIRKVLAANGFEKKTDEVCEIPKYSSFLVGLRNRLFNIGLDYQVGESLNGFDSVGSGMQMALGSLYSTGSMKDQKKRCILALKSAEHFCTSVRRPFHLLEL